MLVYSCNVDECIHVQISAIDVCIIISLDECLWVHIYEYLFGHIYVFVKINVMNVCVG